MQTQEETWDNIANEWYEFKTKPAEHTLKFLKKSSGKILDLGSGSGRHMIKIKKGQMFLVDFSQKMLDLANKKAKKDKINAKFIKANLTRLPFEDDFFNFAICISALHCIKGKKNQRKTVKELYRVLKKNGKAEIGVWNKNSKRFKNSKKEKMIKWRDKGTRYYYLFDEKEVHDLFNSIGFKIISTNNSEKMINFVVKK